VEYGVSLKGGNEYNGRDQMKKYFMQAIKSAAFLAAAVVLVAGCSSEQKSETETASTKQTTYGRAVEKAQDVAMTLSNPKEGLDPVCAMALSEDPVTVTLDDGKSYGFCSENCAESFKADPDKYLVAATTGHEGHDH
jgi:YHS domain-containing protein